MILVSIIIENIMNKINKVIPVNIWDDYYEEGYIPDDKIQKTYKVSG